MNEYMPTKTCAQCGADISYRHPMTKYCSQRCTDLMAAQRGTKNKSHEKQEKQQSHDHIFAQIDEAKMHGHNQMHAINLEKFMRQFLEHPTYNAMRAVLQTMSKYKRTWIIEATPKHKNQG